MSYQIEKLNEARLSDKAEQVYNCLLANQEGLTYPEVAKMTGLKERTVCGRMGDLRPLGLAWTEQPDKGPKVAFATSNKGDIARNIRVYQKAEREKKFGQLRECLTFFKQDFNKGEIYHLAAIVNRLNPTV